MRELLDALAARPAVRSRNAVSYLTVRSWKASTRRDDIRAFKAEKRAPEMPTVATAAEELAIFVGKLIGPVPAVITSVPCGHSRRPDCFGKRLAIETARHLGLPFLQVWRDRFCSGVSHPKEFAKLPPLDWQEIPDRLTIVVDDVATSGWHLEEAVTALRDKGLAAVAVAWIGGTVEGRDRRQPQSNGPGDGEAAGSGSPFGHHRGVWRLPGR